MLLEKIRNNTETKLLKILRVLKTIQLPLNGQNFNVNYDNKQQHQLVPHERQNNIMLILYLYLINVNDF